MPKCKNCRHSRPRRSALIHSKSEFFLECTRHCKFGIRVNKNGVLEVGAILEGKPVACFSERRIVGKKKCGRKAKYFESVEEMIKNKIGE